MTRFTLLAVGLFTLAAATAPAADQSKIPEAVAKGVAYLKQVHRPGQNAAGQPLGHSALFGLALLEGGVKVDDPSLNGIIQYVRSSSYTEEMTYSVCLAIIFLDRLNDPADVGLIQLLGCKLLNGQNAVGGWSYFTWGVTPPAEEARQRAALQPRNLGLVRAGTKFDPTNPGTPPKLHPEAGKILNEVRRGGRAPRAMQGSADDNSNTQFAIVGLWVAQRRGVPCAAAFRGLEGRFIRSQSPSDHGWGYNFGHGGSSPSMTCAGLLGLLAAAARDESKFGNLRMVEDPDAKTKKDPDAFFNPPEGNAGGEDPDSIKQDGDAEIEELSKKNPARDAAIERGLRALGRLLKGNAPAGGGGLGAPPPAQIGGGGGWGGIDDLYFIWSLERVGVACGIDTIGDVDWFNWGCDKILPTQGSDGSWVGSHGNDVATAFAILFLAKSNFVSDLSAKMKGKIKDPGAAELRGTRGGPLGIAANGSREAVRAPGAGGVGGTAGDPDPGLSIVTGPAEADKVADGLVQAKDDDFPARLRNAKDLKGAAYTGGLVRAIARLEGKRQYQAREALADRLARMTVDTLRRMLADRDAELRRAAALACGVRDDKTHVPDLIPRLQDIDDAVVRAVRASLRSLSGGEDFGPPAAATDEQKTKAFEAWTVWYNTAGRGR